MYLLVGNGALEFFDYYNYIISCFSAKVNKLLWKFSIIVDIIHSGGN